MARVTCKTHGTSQKILTIIPRHFHTRINRAECFTLSATAGCSVTRKQSFRPCPPKRVSKKIEFYEYLRRSAANAQWLPAEIFVSKTTPFKCLSKRTKKISKVRLLPKKYTGKRNIVSDCKSIGRKEPSFNILFLAKNIVDPCEIYMDGICKWSLTSGLRFIGYVGIGKFLPFFKNLHFFDFHSKKCSFKANASHDKFFLFWRKQIMSINQAYDRLHSDKVSKFWFLGRFPALLDPYWQ